MVVAVVPLGCAPCVCAVHSQIEKASGSTALPPDGAPQATVDSTLIKVELTPRTGANTWLGVALSRTVTRPGVKLTTLPVAPAPRWLSVAICWAVPAGVAHAA